MKKHIRITAWLLMLGLCAAISGCSFSNDIRDRTEYLKQQQAMLSEDTGWIETPYKLGLALTEEAYYAQDGGKKSECRGVFRVFDFSSDTHDDREISWENGMSIFPRNEGSGLAILKPGSKNDMLYEVTEDFSIGRKKSVKLKDVWTVYALVDENIYYQADEGDEAFYGGDFFTVRHNLKTGKIEKLGIDDFHCVDGDDNLIGKRWREVERLAKDGKTTIAESIYEIGVLNAENKWTGIAEEGWECAFDAIESACWLDENSILIAMSPSDAHETFLYRYDLRSGACEQLASESGKPISLYKAEYMDRVMYPDPSGEYIAYFVMDWSGIGTIESWDSVYVLSLETGQISCVEKDETHTEDEAAEMYKFLCTDMLIWM